MARTEFTELTPAQLTEVSLNLWGEFVSRLDILETRFNQLASLEELSRLTLPLQSLPPATQRLVRMVAIEIDDDEKVYVSLETKPSRFVRGDRGLLLNWQRTNNTYPFNPNNIGLAIRFQETRQRFGKRMVEVDTEYSRNNTEFSKYPPELKQSILDFDSWKADGNEFQQLEVVTELMDLLDPKIH